MVDRTKKRKVPGQHKVTCTCNSCALTKMRWLSQRIDVLQQAYKEDHEALEALKVAQEATDNDLEELEGDLINQGALERVDDDDESGGNPGGDQDIGP